jgi:hypothetical protein
MACNPNKIYRKQPHEYGDSIWQSAFRSGVSFTYDNDPACRAEVNKRNGGDKSDEIRRYLWERIRKNAAATHNGCNDLVSSGQFNNNLQLATALKAYFPHVYAEYLRVRALPGVTYCEINAYIATLTSPPGGGFRIPLAAKAVAARPGDANRGPGKALALPGAPAPTGVAAPLNCQHGSYTNEIGQRLCLPGPSGTAATGAVVAPRPMASSSAVLMNQQAPRPDPYARPMYLPAGAVAHAKVLQIVRR